MLSCLHKHKRSSFCKTAEFSLWDRKWPVYIPDMNHSVCLWALQIKPAPCVRTCVWESVTSGNQAGNQVASKNCCFYTSVGLTHICIKFPCVCVYFLFSSKHYNCSFNDDNVKSMQNCPKIEHSFHSPSDPQLEADTQTVQADPQSFLFCCQMWTKRRETVIIN